METITDQAVLHISSPVFEFKGLIPKQYTCEGKGQNPPLRIQGIPGQAKSLALIMEDPDAPGKTFDHWVTWNIPPSETIYEHSVPGMEGKNSKGSMGYTPPCPPRGTHRYYFKVYAVDTLLDLEEGAGKEELLKALDGNTIAYGELIGVYEKTKKRK